MNPTLTVVQGGTATATFKIAKNCSNIQVNLASYDAPSFDFGLPQLLIDYAPKPLNGPTRFSYSNNKLHTLTTNVSSCFFQVDLVRGAVIPVLTNNNLYGDRKLKWQNGGTKCVTKITTTAKPEAGVAIGGAISDSAVLSGLSPSGGGTLTFKVYGPNDTNCSGTAKFTSTVNVNGSNTYSSGNYTPTAPGTYRWTASYSGDSRNFAVTSPCNAPGESVVVHKRDPTISTTASGNVNLGGQITDTAILGGTLNGTGTITFKLYGPNNATCSGAAIFTTTKPVSGNGSYTSAPFTPTAAGAYRWIASYGGDANNNAVSGACNDLNESVTINRLGPSLTTVASPAVLVGSPISDTAVLGGTAGGTGTITFDLFGPNNATCAGAPIFTNTKTVSGNGSYVSASYTPTQAGVYRWVARYSGDSNNLPVQSTCNEAGESVTVGRDESNPLCVLSQTIAGPPKQLKITVQDPESGIAAIVVDEIRNAIASGNTGFPAGTTAPVVVTATKTNQGSSSFIRLKVTNNAGLVTLCDPIVPATKPKPARAVAGSAGSKFTFKSDSSRVTFGDDRGVVLSGTLPGAGAGRSVTLLSQACSFTGAAALAKVRTGKGGAFSYRLQPGLNAVYSISWKGVTKRAKVSVRPKVVLTRESAGRFRIDVSTTNGMFLDGSNVQLQRATSKGWANVRTVTLAKNSPEDAMIAVSSGTIAASVFGKLRAVLPQSRCYTGGVSQEIFG